MPRLANKVALITGAGSGIGRAAAELFAFEGASVVVADLSSDAGEQTVRNISSAGGSAIFVKTDVTLEQSVKDVVTATTATFGRLNVLYNNAGGSRAGDNAVVDVDMTELWNTINLDLFGTILCCKFAIPEIAKAGGGSIVNTISTVAISGTRRQTGYTVAKGAVAALTRAMAVECAPQKIRVNAVNPTRTLTDRIIRKAAADPSRASLAHRLLLGYAEPIDVAYAALYLASDESRVTTGHLLAVDSGLTISQ